MKKLYEPPEQSAGGQIFDTIVLLVLIYAVLLLPLVLGITAGKTVKVAPEELTWEALGQNETMVAQWEKLGFSIEEAAELITERFDFTISAGSLIVTAVVIVGYFVIVLRMSDREYKDVIAEKFD
ncbi:MAG: hypothetical protein Kow0092_11250 [Deferrisomatales bacterium]